VSQVEAGLTLEEDRVRHRGRVFERGHQRWRLVRAVDGDSGGESRVHDGPGQHLDVGRRSSAEPVDRGADCDLPEPLGQSVRFAGGKAADAGQVCPLIVMRLQRCEVEEDGGAASPALSCAGMRRSGSQPTGLQHILGGEEPVVAGQAQSGPTRAGAYAAYRSGLGPDADRLPPDIEALVQAVVSFADRLVDETQSSTRWDHTARRWES
jgi:hypothetical protein